jgi:exosortase/archaeosortase family protein
VLSRLREVAGGHRLLLRAILLLLAIVAAYNYSLLTLVRGLSLQTPLAYLGLVPFIALLLVVVRALAPNSGPDIRDRHADYIVGVPLLGGALAIMLTLPVFASNFFWLWRLDLVSLPFFVAGAVAIVFGVRTLWRLRLPIAFLFLAWPVPYIRFVNDFLQIFTSATVSSLHHALTIVQVARPLDSPDGSLFSVVHGGQAFLVSVAAACAGVNGMLGFLLVGVAFLAVIRGPLLGKVSWLVVGTALVWGLNLVRLLLILAVGQRFGEGVAIDGVHPFIGLVIFNLGVLAMVFALPLFRLRIDGVGTSGSAPIDRGSRPGPLNGRVTALAVQRSGAAFTVVLAAALLAAVANVGMAQFEVLAQDLGTPRLHAFNATDAQVQGWLLTPTESYPWVRQYFGEDAAWTRYNYASQPSWAGRQAFRSVSPVVLDVISSSDLGTFSTYGLEACYQFHKYQILDAHRFDLGGGVIGHSLVYHIPSRHEDWLAVYWVWPVETSHGQAYERVVLNMTNPSTADLQMPPLRPTLARSLGLVISDWIGPAEAGPIGDRLLKGRNFLVGFAQQVVMSAAGHSQTTGSGGVSS